MIFDYCADVIVQGVNFLLYSLAQDHFEINRKVIRIFRLERVRRQTQSKLSIKAICYFYLPLQE